ncbi:MAG TPA: RDD family protein [Patescibacteria group bacterium]|nr:RDD family protein [Patescibacteria group bacterium]
MKNNNKYSTFYDRLISKLIDAGLFSLVFLFLLYSVSFSTEMNQLLNGILNLMIFFLTTTVLILPVEAFLTSRFGGTFGKILTAQKIIKSDGMFLTFWESIFRLTVGYVVSGAFFGLGYFHMFKDQKKRTWHDLIGKTVVVKRNLFTPVLGILILLLIWLVNIGVFSMTVSRIIQNGNLYTEIYEQASKELNLTEPTPTTDPNKPVDLKTY